MKTHILNFIKYLLPLGIFLLPIPKAWAIACLILLGIIYMIEFYLLTIFSYLMGAEHALKNPPKPGRTWVKWNLGKEIFGIEKDIYGNDIAYKSEPFLFSPEFDAESEPEPYEMSFPFVDIVKQIQQASRNFASGIKGGRPDGGLKNGNNINMPDVAEWHKEAKRILEKVGYKEFVAYCNEAGENESTVRSRIKKFFP